MSSKVLQYVVVRRDILPANKLKSAMSFSLGACMAQACHAATAALHESRNEPETHTYLNDLENMTVCVLSADTDTDLRSLADSMRKGGIHCHLWVEKPENIVTALATAPQPKEIVFPFVQHLKLLR